MSLFSSRLSSGYRFRPVFLPFLPFASSFSRYSVSLRQAVQCGRGGLDEPTNPGCKRKRGETKTHDGPVTRSNGREREKERCVCEINNFHGPTKNNTLPTTVAISARHYASSAQRNALSAARISSVWIFFKIHETRRIPKTRERVFATVCVG